VNTPTTGGRDCALVLAGGVALGVYHAGAYAALHERGILPTWIAGSSIGAINAALIAGAPPERRIAVLEEFWGIAAQPPSGNDDLADGILSLRHLACWTSVIQTRLMGVPGHFATRLQLGRFKSLYDLSPMRARLEKLVDFDRLNTGSVRLTVMTTDLESGEAVVFDTAKADRITVDHLMASCGLPPEFGPVKIGDRVLGDGGLWANAPVEPVLHELDGGLCVVVDTYSRRGSRPTSLESGMARKTELFFANQTWQQLDAYKREVALREEVAKLRALLERKQGRAGGGRVKAARRPAEIMYVCYCAPDWEAGPERPFDYSRETVASRWVAGTRDMLDGLESLSQPLPPVSCGQAPASS